MKDDYQLWFVVSLLVLLLISCGFYVSVKINRQGAIPPPPLPESTIVETNTFEFHGTPAPEQ